MIWLRRLRNRLSQQAFRRRQKESLRELRNQAQSKDKPENEIIHELREENSKLRKELLDVQSKLSRYISSMESLTGSISSALQGTSDEKVESEAELEIESSNSPQEQSSLPAQAGISELDLEALNDMNVFSFGNSQNLLNDTMTTGNPTPLTFVNMKLTIQGYGKSAHEDSSNIETSLMKTEKASSFDPSANINVLSPSLSDIWSFEYQMGSQPYATNLSLCQDSSTIIGRSWTVTNSPFSDHILALQNLLKRQMQHIRPLAEGSTYLYVESHS